MIEPDRIHTKEIIITDRVPLERYAGAIEAFESGAGLKTQVVP